MHSYHVYFTPKDGISDAEVGRIVRAFGENEKNENLLHSYDLVKFDNKANFQELFDFHFAAHYQSEKEREKAFETMSEHYTEEPHLSLMKMTKEFKVAFSTSI